jgi:hypothetical protein
MRDYTEAANKYAKEKGKTEPDWLRKQTVEDFIAGATFADKANEMTDCMKEHTFAIVSSKNNKLFFWGGSTKPKFGSFTSVKLYKTETLANKTLEDRKRRMDDPLWRTAYVLELKVEFGKICTYR